VFVDDHVAAMFLTLLGQLPERYGVIVHGYAIMPNHFHLLLESTRGNLSRAMRHLTGVFTQRLNAMRGWDGPVFRGRYRNRVVETDAYWMHLLAYVHLNPLRAHLVMDLADDAWTSHLAYVGKSTAPQWLTTSGLLELFGSRAELRRYIEDVHSRREPAPEGFDAEALWDSPPPADERAVRHPVTVEQALAQLEVVTGFTRDELTKARRGRGGSPARWVAAWWLARSAGLTHGAIGRLLGCGTSGAHRLARQASKHAEDPEVARWRERLTELATPG
jgi:putative transposase